MYGFLYVADKYEGLVIVGDPDLKGRVQERVRCSMAIRKTTFSSGRWRSIRAEF